MFLSHILDKKQHVIQDLRKEMEDPSLDLPILLTSSKIKNTLIRKCVGQEIDIKGILKDLGFNV